MNDGLDEAVPGRGPERGVVLFDYGTQPTDASLGQIPTWNVGRH